MPAANEVQCGWGANHSLEAAQEAVRAFLAARPQWEVVIPETPADSGGPAAPGTAAAAPAVEQDAEA